MRKGGSTTGSKCSTTVEAPALQPYVSWSNFWGALRNVALCSGMCGCAFGGGDLIRYKAFDWVGSEFTDGCVPSLPPARAQGTGHFANFAAIRDPCWGGKLHFAGTARVCTHWQAFALRKALSERLLMSCG